MVMKSRRLMLPPAMGTAECDSQSLALFDRLARKKPEARCFSLPGRASSKPGHVRYIPKAEASSLLWYALAVDGDAHDVISRSGLLKAGKVPFQKT